MPKVRYSLAGCRVFTTSHAPLSAGDCSFAVCSALAGNTAVFSAIVLAMEPFAWKHSWAELSSHHAPDIANSAGVDDSDEAFDRASHMPLQ
jgi:hypothetical protein